MFSLTSTIIMVAETIHIQQAIMLPAVSAYYTSFKPAPTRNTKWLLQQIQEALGHHIKSVCKHKKYGTILYTAGGNLLQALSVALGSKNTSSDERATVPKITCTFEEALQLVGEINF